MREQQVNNYIGKYTLTVSPDFSIEDALIRDGVWEAQVLRCISSYVNKGDTCIDIGANCGLITIAIADQVGTQGEVHAFEPSSVMFPRLKRNVDHNPSLHDRIRLHKCGLGDRRGSLKLFEAGDKPGNAYMAQSRKANYWNRGGEYDFETCPVETVDNLFQGQHIDFIKIDVEGMEYDVLLGSVNTLKQSLPIIVFETLLECFDNEKIRRCDELLTSLGYLLFVIHPVNGLLVPTHFPNLSEDTVAIHTSKVGGYREHMLNQELLDVALNRVLEDPEVSGV